MTWFLIIAFCLVIYWIIWLIRIPTMLFFAIAMVVVVITYVIASKIHDSKTIKLTDEQQRKVDGARALDEQNSKINEQNRLAAIKRKREECQPKIDACQAELRELEEQLQVCQKELDGMDVLPKKDMKTETVHFLIAQMEGRRADSIKEALQQYDASRRSPAPAASKPSKYTGKDWDLYSVTLNGSTVAELEKDLCDLMYVLAHTTDQDALARTWFSNSCMMFTLAAVSQDTSAGQANNIISDKLSNSPSWILRATEVVRSTVGTNILTSLLCGGCTVSAKFQDAKLRASTEREREFEKNAIVAVERLTNALYRRCKAEM